MSADQVPAGRELNTAVALEVMGWYEWDGVGDWDGPEGVTMFTYWGDDDGALAVYPDSSDEPKSLFDPSHCMGSACEVEDEIERRGLGSQYAGALAVRIRGGLWDMLRATPEQRCRAALVVVRTVGGAT